MTTVKKKPTATDTFGREMADKLAALAIDIACDAPTRQTRFVSEAKVSWRFVHEVRDLLEQAGVDWRSLAAAEDERKREVRAAARKPRPAITSADFADAINRAVLQEDDAR